MIRILFSGQSNCNGYGDTGGGEWDISPYVLARNNAPDRDDNNLLGNSWVVPDRNERPFYQGNNNQGVQFASLAAKLYNSNVRLVVVGRNGRSINYWHDGTATGVMYTRMRNIAQAAIPGAPYDVFLWNQGSADKSNPCAYTAKFEALVAQMKIDGLITDDTPIILSETGPNSQPINPVLEAIAASNPKYGYARIGSLPTSDGVHFTGESLVRAGMITLCALAGTDTPYRRI